MNIEKKNTISVYPVNKWVNKWVIKRGARDFVWRISTKAPTDSLHISPDQMMVLTESGLSPTAKSIFAFLFHHRFSTTRVCLYGSLTIAQMYGCANNTARKALKELEASNIIGKLKIYTGKNVSYQYYITDYGKWILPKNRRSGENIEAPMQVIELDE